MSGSTTQGAIAPIDLAAEREALGPALGEAVQRVLESGRYVLGPEVEAFERGFAELHGVEHGVGVASGTDALILSLVALGIGPGDGVVTTPFTFFSSAGSIPWIGATPQLADVDPETALLDPERAREAIDGSTRCLLPVHLYGQPCDMAAFRALADERGLALLEDGAQAHGAQRDDAAPGALGDACAFSFYPTKNLGAAGEGGLILTRDARLAARLRELRDHGSTGKYVHSLLGTNSRLHSLQAAVLNVKLPHLSCWNDARRGVAARYDAHFRQSSTVLPLRTAPGVLHARHQYAVRIRGGEGREAVHRGLSERGIGAAVHYPTPVHLQEAARSWGYGPGDFPAAEALAREILCLPVHPFLREVDVDRVAEAVLELAGG